MHRRFGLLLAALALAIAMPAATLAAPPATAFAGTWTSTDFDGSTQLLVVAGGGRPSVVFQDFYASGCDTFGGPATHWVAAGVGSVDGNALFIDYHKSGCGRFLQGGYSDAYWYDAGTDTLTDTVGITWTRLT
jgi:hypothetical protein